MQRRRRELIDAAPPWRVATRIAIATLVACASLVAACDSRSKTAPSASESAASAPSTSAAVASAIAPMPPPPPAPLAVTAIASDPEARDRVQKDVEYLASDELAGRATGEEGARLTTEFIAKRFEELGLVPFGDRADPNDPKSKRSFLYRFSAFRNAKAAPAALTVVLDAPAADAGAPAPKVVDASALQTADGAASEAVNGDAVFAGWGVTSPEWDDYGGADVEGKIVVVLRGSPKIPKKTERELYELATFRRKIKTARDHKAAGLVIISTNETLPQPPFDPKSAGLPAVVVKRSVAVGLFPGSGLDDLKTWFATAPAAPKPLPSVHVSLQTHVEALEKWANDVVGLLPACEGSATPDEWLVVGGHHDHLGMGGDARSMAPWMRAIHHGADDNASGTALVLEVARRFSRLPRRPSRNVVFMAFGAEEMGLLGSEAWVDDPPVPMTKFIGMVNADMVGRLRKNQLTIEGTKSVPGWKDLFELANQGIDLDLQRSTTDEFADRSDHASFRAANVPVAFLFTGLHPDYHRPSDTADKINAEGLDRIATFAGRLVLGLSERGLRPAEPIATH